MIASAWNGGQTGYGICIGKADRDAFFKREWSEVYISIEGKGQGAFRITKSFWNKCTEIRGIAIRAWFKELGHVDQHNHKDWPKGSPPKFHLVPVSGKEGHFLLSER